MARNPRSVRCILSAPKRVSDRWAARPRGDERDQRSAQNCDRFRDSTGLNCCPTAPLGALRCTSVSVVACKFQKSSWPERWPDTVRNVEAEGSSPFTSTLHLHPSPPPGTSIPAGRSQPVDRLDLSSSGRLNLSGYHFDDHSERFSVVGQVGSSVHHLHRWPSTRSNRRVFVEGHRTRTGGRATPPGAAAEASVSHLARHAHDGLVEHNVAG